jgi:hypothetical protein
MLMESMLIQKTPKVMVRQTKQYQQLQKEESIED